jgi:hypothetical protein
LFFNQNNIVLIKKIDPDERVKTRDPVLDRAGQQARFKNYNLMAMK